MNELEILVADKLSEYFHDPIDIPCPYCEAAKAIIPTIKIAAIQEVVEGLKVKGVESHSEGICCPHCGEEFRIEQEVEPC